MSRKKRKNSKNRARDGDLGPSRQETSKGKEIVDEKLVKAGAFRGATVDDFSEAGYGCDHCDWTTAKRGSAGIQALRAHSKVHVRDRRAVVNTLIVQMTVLVVAITIALSPMFMRVVPIAARSEIRLYVPIDAELIIAAMVTASILLTIAIPLTGYRYFITGKRRWWSRYTWLARILVVLMWSSAGLRWLDVGQDIWLPWLTSVLVPWVFWFWIGDNLALTRLAVKRGAFKPRSQRKLLKSKNKITDYRVTGHRRSLEAAIRDGRILLAKLSRKRRDYFNRLGLGKTKLDKRMKQRRLKTTKELRHKIEQRDLRNRRERDRWGRRPDDPTRRA